jgi:hypothetical protein
VAAPALQRVSAGTAGQNVVAGAALQKVVAFIAVQVVVPVFPAQRVATGAAAQPQPPRRPADAPRTIDGINTVWLEELTQPEFRDKLKEGYTTVLVLTGGVENNDGNLQMNKHNINNQLLGDMIARKMGKTLVAPLVTLVETN